MRDRTLVFFPLAILGCGSGVGSSSGSTSSLTPSSEEVAQGAAPTPVEPYCASPARLRASLTIGNGGLMKPQVALVAIDARRVLFVHAESATGAPPLQIFADVVDVDTGAIIRHDRLDDPDREFVLDLVDHLAFGRGNFLVAWRDRRDDALARAAHVEARVFHDDAWSSPLSSAVSLQSFDSAPMVMGDDLFVHGMTSSSTVTAGWSESTGWESVDSVDGWIVHFDDGRLARIEAAKDHPTRFAVRDGLGPWSTPMATMVYAESALPIENALLFTWHVGDVTHAQAWSLGGAAAAEETLSPGPVHYELRRFGAKAHLETMRRLADGSYEWLGIIDECDVRGCAERPYVRRRVAGAWGSAEALRFRNLTHSPQITILDDTEQGPIFSRPDGFWIVPRTAGGFGDAVLLAPASYVPRNVGAGTNAVWIVAGHGSTPTRFGRYEPSTHAVTWATVPDTAIPWDGATSGIEDPAGGFVLVNDVLDEGAHAFVARWDGSSPPELFPPSIDGLSYVSTPFSLSIAPDARALVVPSIGYLTGGSTARVPIAVFNAAGRSEVVLDPPPADVGGLGAWLGPSLSVGCGGVVTVFEHGRSLVGEPVYRGLDAFLLR